MPSSRTLFVTLLFTPFRPLLFFFSSWWRRPLRAGKQARSEGLPFCRKINTNACVTIITVPKRKDGFNNEAETNWWISLPDEQDITTPPPPPPPLCFYIRQVTVACSYFMCNLFKFQTFLLKTTLI